ncbi:FRIGIDA-like protein 3 [Malania oleifera]|uniref:FRIGIDA-like protein 3 n=1 Tax=Malania oleifera TaxID=397392 RepID=UPI0025ADE821|nr:FRIGIDA-like protein 3 [Malania oleifera]
MADTEQVVGNDIASSLLEQLGKAFLELQALNCAPEEKVQWVEIEEHFCNLETTLKKKFEELEFKEKEFEDKKSETTTLLAEREAAVVTKEQDFIDRVQEIKDAAVAAIADARATYQPKSLEPFDGGDNKASKVSRSLGDTHVLPTDSKEKSPYMTDENAEGMTVGVKPRPELTQFCEHMDAKGLLKFAMENRKNLSAFRDEFSVALESATEPAHLVLGSLEGFYPPDETTQQGDKKDAALLGMRQSCVVFMEAMAALLARADPGADHLLNPETRQQAKVIADEWKPKLAGAGIDAANGNSLEAEAFLQLLATFNIASEFDEEELCKVVLAVAHRRQAPELCRSLGLAHKMAGVIQELIDRGKQIDAVRFIHAFQLSESFSPMHLLEMYLQNHGKNLQEKGGNSGGTGGAQNLTNAQELAALRDVIRCVEECKLEAEYPLDTLQKRVSQLEKSKNDKKGFGNPGKHNHRKKPRAGGGFNRFRAPSAATAVTGRHAPPAFAERPAYMGMPERYPHAGPNTNYQLPNQSNYAQPVNDQRLYYYSQDDRTTSTAYNAAPPPPSNYGGYMGSGLQSSHQHQPYM